MTVSSFMPEAMFSSLLDLRLRFLGFLVRRVNDPAIAEDILQSAYVRALQAGGQLRNNESAVAWFYRILRNAVIDYYRRSAAEGAAMERWAKDLEIEGVTHSPSPDRALQETTCQCIGRA